VSRENVRILHIDTGTGWRGGQQQVLWLMEALRARGSEQLLLPPANSPLVQRIRKAELPAAELALPTMSLANLQTVRARRGAFDLVHAHDSHAHSLAALAAIGGAHRPLVVSRRVAFSVAALGRLKYRKADAYIAVSDFVRRRLLGAHVPDSKIRVVFDGVSFPAGVSESRTQFRSRNGVDSRTILLGTLTSLAPEKLLEAELDFLAELPPSVHFWMGIPSNDRNAGTERTESALLERARSRGLAGRFRIMRIGEDAGPFIGSLDIFIYLSKLEGLGSAILLAMAHGLPVLANRVGGIPEIVHNNKTGFLADAVPGPELPRFARQLFDSPELRQRLGAAARDFVLAHATCDRMAAQTVAVYEELLQHGVSSSASESPD
jgi:glycosyltransferase involved in cell wall biosynthesis